MNKRRCTCGAAVNVRKATRRREDGSEEIVYYVLCPVCGQSGPSVTLEGKDELMATAEAVTAWNAMIARLRPLES